MVKTYSGRDHYYACGYPYGEWIKVWGVGDTPKTAIQAAKENLRKEIAGNPDSSWASVYGDLRVFEIEEWLYSILRKEFETEPLPRECVLEEFGIRAINIDRVGL